MEAELIAARERIQALEHQVATCLSEAERVRADARSVHRAQAQLQQQLFALQRRVDNYSLVNAQLSRQVYPPPPHTHFHENEVLVIDIP